MKDKTKDFIVSVSFTFVLILFLILNIIKKDDEISIQERRKLASFPEISKETLTNGEFSDEFETYSNDQFVGRNLFRKVKYYFNDKILMQNDTNKLFVKDNSIYKLDYKLSETSIKNVTDRMNYIKEKYLDNSEIYYSIIPDKTYYLDDNYLKLDYEKIKNIMSENLTDFKYIDIFSDLNINDYYRTDLHWKQENLEKISNKMLNEIIGESYKKSKYNFEEIDEFYGAYYGQLGANIEPDKIIYLTNDVIQNSKTYNVETLKTKEVYDLDKITSPDKYDIFVSGATPIINIENENAENSKKLILFRDSFGSSFAPLLLENYSEIVLIDLRYINYKFLEEYVDFENSDVLFLYSGVVLNSNTIK